MLANLIYYSFVFYDSEINKFKCYPQKVYSTIFTLFENKNKNSKISLAK